MTTSSALEISQLKFSYGKNPVLHVPEFKIGTGEFVFLFGPSGSGKSTLLELTSGILHVDEGTLTVLGERLDQKSMAELDHFRAQQLGYIFQSFNLVPYLTVTENIKLPLMFSKTEFDPTWFDELIAGLGLKNFLSRNVSDLSVGQQQRVAVARALLKKPKLILADEPTSALDYDHRESFLKLMFQFCRKNQTSVLFVSHDRSIEKLFDRSVSLPSINQVKAQGDVV